MSCWAKRPDPPRPTIDASAIQAARSAVCRSPSAPERDAITRLMLDVLPTGPDGVAVDVMPGVELPDGVAPAARPDLYAAAAWVSATYCRCWPDLCVRPAARPAGPADDPDPVSAPERGRPPGAP